MGWSSNSNNGTTTTNSQQTKRAFVATRASWYTQNTFSGTTAGNTFRVRHIATTNCSDISFMYANPTANALTIKASIEDGGGNLYQVTFGGQTQFTLATNGVVTSDPVSIELTKGTMFYSRSFVSVGTAGNPVPTGTSGFTGTYNGTTLNEGVVSGDVTMTVGTPATATAQGCFSPIAIIGTPNNGAYVPSILYLGDSISWGQGDTDPLSGQMDNYGFVVRALNNNFGYYALAKSGERAYTYGDSTDGTNPNYTAMQNHYLRFAPLQYCTHAIVEFGQNDFYNNTTEADMQTYLKVIINSLTRRGIKVYGTTITPRTTSTDTWATTTNQTIVTNFGYNQIGVLNNWIRNNWNSLGLSGYFETADTVMPWRNSCLWKPGMVSTADGIHPNVSGHQAMAGAVNTSAFTSTGTFVPTPSGSLPTAPTGLTHSSLMYNSWTSSWTAVTGASAYNVYLNGSLVAPNVTGTSYSFSGETGSTQYSVTVTALNQYGESVQSSSDTFITPAAPAVTTYVSDSFNRADNTAALGTADVGGTWSALVGTWGIATNQARIETASGGDDLAVINSTASDGVVRVTFATEVLNQRIVFRCSDASNYWIVQADTASTYALYKNVAGAFSAAIATYSVAPKNGDQLEVALSGNSIIVYINGTQYPTTTDSFNATATQHGMGCHGSTTVRWDDFSVKSA